MPGASGAGPVVRDEYFNRFDGNDREIGGFYLNHIYFDVDRIELNATVFAFMIKRSFRNDPAETFVTLNVNTARGISRDYNVPTILNGARSARVLFVHKSPGDSYSLSNAVIIRFLSDR